MDTELIMKRVIVTGATSMIGVSLIDALICDAGIEKIYAVIRPGSIRANRISESDKVKLVECDIKEYETLQEKISEKCDVFYHLAWARTSTYEESLEDMIVKCQNLQTVLYAVNVAEELGCRSFVGVGSQAEYGLSNGEPFAPQSICNPVRADGIVHLAAGKLAMKLSDIVGIDCIWMRVFSVYGIYDRQNSMIMDTIQKLVKGQKCAFTPAEQKWDYLYADDIGRAFYLVGKMVKGSHIYCVGAGKTKQLKEYINIIQKEINPDAELGIGILSYPKNPVMYLCADISDLQKDTGWEPEVSFEEGVHRICKFLKRPKEI